MRRFVLLLLVLLTGRCTLTNHHTEQAPIHSRTLNEEEQQLVTSQNQFGLTLFRTLNEAEAPESNVFLSPLSVSMALGMTLNGARADTRAALQEALGLAGHSPEAINRTYEHLVELVTELDPNVRLTLAQSIWYREGFDVDSDFIKTNENYFDAEVTALEFGNAEALSIINRWVRNKTNGKIDRIIRQIDSNEVMLLLNALHFQGTWTRAFDSTATREEPFTRYDGTTTQVPMMQQTTALPYFESDGFQAIDLPYGDSLFSMTVFLPNEDRDVNTLLATLDAAQWRTWETQFAPRTVNLRLPRFTLEYEETLNDVLSSLGMAIAFDCNTADFSGMSRHHDLCVSRVKHRSFVEVDEAGTEAAATTAVGIRVTSAENDVTTMHVDRPFLFVIRERHADTILFTGKVGRL